MLFGTDYFAINIFDLLTWASFKSFEESLLWHVLPSQNLHAKKHAL